MPPVNELGEDVSHAKKNVIIKHETYCPRSRHEQSKMHAPTNECVRRKRSIVSNMVTVTLHFVWAWSCVIQKQQSAKHGSYYQYIALVLLADTGLIQYKDAILPV